MTNNQHGQVPDALLPIQRYKIGYATDGWGERSSTPGGIPDPSGQWVRYEDHAAALLRLHAYCQELEAQVIRDCMTHVQNPAEIEHVADDVSKNGAELNMSTQQGVAYARVSDADIDRIVPALVEVNEEDYPTEWAIWKDRERIRKELHALRTQQPAPATQQVGEVRPVTPYTCPKCHALWLHWPAEQTGFGRDTLNCRSADHCHYCEKAGVEQLQRLERIPAALHAPQPSPTAQAADSVPAVDHPPLPTRRRTFLCTKCGGRECEPGTIGEPHPPCKCGYLGFAEDLDFTADDMRAFADETYALRIGAKHA